MGRPTFDDLAALLRSLVSAQTLASLGVTMVYFFVSMIPEYYEPRASRLAALAFLVALVVCFGLARNISHARQRRYAIVVAVLGALGVAISLSFMLTLDRVVSGFGPAVSVLLVLIWHAAYIGSWAALGALVSLSMHMSWPGRRKA